MNRKLTLAAAAIAAATTIAVASPAAASPLDGTNPYNGCSAGASVVATRQFRTNTGTWLNAYMKVYYSPRCGTNWIWVTNTPNGDWTNKQIFSDAGGSRRDADYGYGASYSYQVYAPGSACVEAQAFFGAYVNYSPTGTYAFAEAHIC